MKAMTKILCLLLCLLMLVCIFVACDIGDVPTTDESQDSETKENGKLSDESKDPDPTPDSDIDPEPVENGIQFKTLSADGTNVYGKVSNATEIFSFLNEITVNGTATYVVSLDIYGMQPVVTKTVTLTVGDNVFYVLQIVGEDITTYTVTIRRRPMHMVRFDTDGGTAVASQTIEEDNFMTMPDTPWKEGYTFVGWDRDLTLAITEQTTVTAQ